MDVQAAVVKAAHDRGMIAVGHAFSYAGAMALLHAGADGLTHMFLDEPSDDDFVRVMKSQGAHCSPTLALCASHTGEAEDLQRQFVAESFAQRMLFDKWPLKLAALAASQHPRACVQHAYNSLRKLYEARVAILVGTDAAGGEFGVQYGLGVHMEMYLLSHKVGMEPVDVMKSATSMSADRFGFSDRGRLDAGLLADMVLLEGDIRLCLSDASCLCLPVKAVWRGGEVASVFASSCGVLNEHIE